ncbi:MAG: GNAT family N-acetyltransferase [Clostridiales bacterium]|nr:GNAT family N-acetyltransferase [Clostridiales bacterium]
MIVRKIKPEEFQRVQQFCSLAFEYPYNGSHKGSMTAFREMQSHPGSRQDLFWDSQWAAFQDDDRTMMSTFTVVPYTIHFDGHSARMAGIGGVATLPQYRRNGGVRACFESALPDMYESGYVFSYLYPFSTAFYRRFGYELGCDRIKYELDLNGITPVPQEGHCLLLEPGYDLTAQIKQVDQTWQQRYNMMVLREDIEYRWVKKADPFASLEYTYVYVAKDGTPKGYMTYKPNKESSERTLECSRFCFTDAEGFRGLLNLLLSLRTDHGIASLHLPVDVDLSTLLPEWSLGVIKRTLQSFGMVRVVNVEEALRMARASGDGQLTLAITDEQIRQNNDTFAVSYANGKVVNVQRTNEKPDIEMTIQAFSRMLAGRCKIDAYPLLEDFTLHCSADEASQLFFQKPMYICQYF